MLTNDIAQTVSGLGNTGGHRKAGDGRGIGTDVWWGILE